MDILENPKRDSMVLPDGIYGLSDEPVLVTVSNGDEVIVTWMERHEDVTCVYTGIIRRNGFTQTSVTILGDDKDVDIPLVKVMLPSGKEADAPIDFSTPYEIPKRQHWDEPTPPSPEDLEKINAIFSYIEGKMGCRIPTRAHTDEDADIRA